MPYCVALDRLLNFFECQFLLVINGILTLFKGCHKDEVALNELIYAIAPCLAWSTCSTILVKKAVSDELLGIQAALVFSRGVYQMRRVKAKPGVRQLETSQSHIHPGVRQDPGDCAIHNEAPSDPRSPAIP